MQIPSAGARTRNVINIANPGGTGTKAIEVDKDNKTVHDDEPSGATDGFANFRRQRYLHIQAKMESASIEDADEINLYVWLYNSMSGIWTRAQVHDQQAGAGNIDLKLNIKGSAARTIYYILDIKGAERVYIQAKNYTDNNGTDLKFPVYLGVNSF